MLREIVDIILIMWIVAIMSHSMTNILDFSKNQYYAWLPLLLCLTVFDQFVVMWSSVGERNYLVNTKIFQLLEAMKLSDTYLNMLPVVQRTQRYVLEDKLQSMVMMLFFMMTDCHEEEDAWVRDSAQVVQLSDARVLLHRHLGQVPQLPNHSRLGTFIIILIFMFSREHCCVAENL